MEDCIYYLKLFSCFKYGTMVGVGKLLLFQSLGLLMLNVRLFIWKFQIISLVLSDELSSNVRLVIINFQIANLELPDD